MATDGYGINGYVFYLPWLWDAGPGGAFVVYFTLALFFFVLGFTGATIYKSWGQLVLIIVGIALSLVLLGLVFLVTRLDLWSHVGAGIMDLGALGLALWGLLATAVLTGVSFLAFRRTIRKRTSARRTSRRRSPSLGWPASSRLRATGTRPRKQPARRPRTGRIRSRNHRHHAPPARAEREDAVTQSQPRFAHAAQASHTPSAKPSSPHACCSSRRRCSRSVSPG